MARTRIKFCGLTNPVDIAVAVDLGVDFIGFVFYSKSPRSVTAEMAATLRRRLPSYVQAVGLFVNSPAEEVASISTTVGLDILQFHGDETTVDCLASFRQCAATRNTRAFWQALRLKCAEDLLPWVPDENEAAARAEIRPEGLLLDSFSPLFGGSGHGFDWNWVSQGSATRPTNIALIASGGLDPNNVAEAILKIRPFAVDVSSGIQTSDPRRKDALLMERFVEQVMKADASLL
jgi:phosphoribosylanthranilate isomerase